MTRQPAHTPGVNAHPDQSGELDVVVRNCRRLLAGAGILLLLVGLAVSAELLRELFSSRLPLDQAWSITRSRFIGLGITLMLAAVLLRIPIMSETAQKRPGLLFMLPIVAFVLILEWGLYPFVVLPDPWHIDDATLGWRLRPGNFVMEDGTPISINAMGLRGPDIQPDMSPGVLRVLFVGDSGTFGELIGNELATYPQLVGRLLSVQCQRPVQAFNAGVIGYAPWHYAEVIRRVGPLVQPHLVILCLNPGDVQPPGERERYLATAARRLAKSPLVLRMTDRSAIRAVASQIRNALPPNDPATRGRQVPSWFRGQEIVFQKDEPLVREAIAVTRRDLTEVATTARGYGWPIVTLLYPWRVQVLDVEAGSAANATLTELASAAGMPVFDPLREFRANVVAAERPIQEFYANSTHLNEYASLLYAQMVSQYLYSEARICE